MRYLTNLTELNVMANQLTSLPECVATMTGLTDLEITRNKFKKLPEHLGLLRLLPSLNIDCNEWVLGNPALLTCTTYTRSIFVHTCARLPSFMHMLAR